MKTVNDEDDEVLFVMDGTEHSKGDCDQFGKRCKCGGWMHYQPIYGGYYYKCEECMDEAS